MNARRMLVEPKMILAGTIDETFSARFVPSIAAFNRSMAPSRPSGCWDPAFMVETGGGGERTVGCEGCDKRARRLAQTSLACGEENCILGRSAEKRRAWSIRRPQSRKELTRCPHQLCTCLFDRDWLPLLIPFRSAVDGCRNTTWLPSVGAFAVA